MRNKFSAGLAASLSLLVFASAGAETLSPVEQGVRRELNHARTDPHDFRVVSVVGSSTLPEARSFLDSATPVPPLVWDERLRAAALRHLADKGPKGQGDHTGSDGSTPGQRIQQAGVVSSTIAEEISLGQPSAEAVVSQLIIDGAGPWRPHRQDVFSANFTKFGLACGPNARWGTMCVVDLSGPPLTAANGETAAADQPRAVMSDCPTWIDAKTGARVPTLPQVLSREDFSLSRGQKSVHSSITGQNFAETPNGNWIDASTGKSVPTLPQALTKEEFSLGRGQVSLHSSATGQNFSLILCPPAGHR